MHPDTDIHTDFTFAVQIALGQFQQLVAEMLDEIDNPALLEPDTDAYRIRSSRSGGRFAVEVDLQLAYGAVQRLAIPFSGSIEQMRSHLAKAQERLEAVLVDLDGATALRNAIATYARQLSRNASRAGIRIAITKVELSPIDLTFSMSMGRVAVHYEIAVCDMLRPLSHVIYADTVRSFREQFMDLREGQKPREARAAAAAAIGNGAIGFIDSVALAMIDTFPGGRDVILKRMVREWEDTIWPEDPQDRAGVLSLRWRDGVIQAFGRLAEGVQRSGDMIRVAPNTVSADAVGKPVEDYVAAPFLDGLTTVAVEPLFGEVTLSEQLVAFEASAYVYTCRCVDLATGCSK